MMLQRKVFSLNNICYFLLQLTSSDGAFLPRHVLLKSGIPLEKPALGVNRLCGTGFQTIVNGAQVLTNKIIFFFYFFMIPKIFIRN